MSHRALQRIIGTAVTDPEFCTDLLNGKRQIILAAFDLSTEERGILLTIEANSLQEFASRLEEQLQLIEEYSTDNVVDGKTRGEGRLDRARPSRFGRDASRTDITAP